MVLPSSGAIYMSQINAELGVAATTAVDLNIADVRLLFGKSSGVISMSDGYSRGLIPGTYDQYAVGRHYITMPWYNTLFVDVYGAGGGGGGAFPNTANPSTLVGTPGGLSSFYSSTAVTGNGGAGGRTTSLFAANGAAGAAGDGTDGDVNITGGGAAGGIGQQAGTIVRKGGDGGAGGRAYKTFTRGAAGAPIPYTEYAIDVGAGGQSANVSFAVPYDGASGRVYLSWS